MENQTLEPENLSTAPDNGHAEVLKHYSDAVGMKAYERDAGGLFGKHDNVRRYWEDQINRYTFNRFLEDLVAAKHRSLSRMRVLDLGCGSGEGYEILTDLRRQELSLGHKEVMVLPSHLMGLYKGVDISPAMAEKAREIYGDSPKLRFEVADLNDGLPVAADEAPYDLYFSSFGSLSHLDDGALGRLVEDICDHMGERAIFVADVVGRFSYEWQCYWDQPGADEVNMHQYSMSYIYPPDMLDKVDVVTFPLRYWGGGELDEFVGEIAARKGIEVARREIRDRSVLVGRHMDTAEFNPHAPPIRQMVCSLHEFNLRTDLEQLLFDYIPHAHHPHLNQFFEEFQMAWNAVVYACLEALDDWRNGDKLQEDPSDEYPEAVQQSIRTIRDVVRNVKWFRMGDPLANIVEPQLGYVLRNLESDLQQGLGAAHGVLASFELVRKQP